MAQGTSRRSRRAGRAAVFRRPASTAVRYGLGRQSPGWVQQLVDPAQLSVPSAGMPRATRCSTNRPRAHPRALRSQRHEKPSGCPPCGSPTPWPWTRRPARCSSPKPPTASSKSFPPPERSARRRPPSCDIRTGVRHLLVLATCSGRRLGSSAAAGSSPGRVRNRGAVLIPSRGVAWRQPQAARSPVAGEPAHSDTG